MENRRITLSRVNRILYVRQHCFRSLLSSRVWKLPVRPYDLGNLPNTAKQIPVTVIEHICHALSCQTGIWYLHRYSAGDNAFRAIAFPYGKGGKGSRLLICLFYVGISRTDETIKRIQNRVPSPRKDVLRHFAERFEALDASWTIMMRQSSLITRMVLLKLPAMRTASSSPQEITTRHGWWSCKLYCRKWNSSQQRGDRLLKNVEVPDGNASMFGA